MKKFLWALGLLMIFLGIQAGITLIVQWFAKYIKIDNDSVMMLATVLFSIITSILFIRVRWSVVGRSYIQSKPWAQLFWVFIAAVGLIIPSMWLQELLPELPDWVDEKDLLALIMLPGSFFVIGILAPLAEELVFRGAILRYLLDIRVNTWVAIILSAVLFSLAHLNPAQMVHAFLIGILLGWMYSKTDSIVPCLILHCFNNIASVFIMRMYPDPSLRLIDLFGGNQHAVWMAVFFSLCLLGPALFQLVLRLKKAKV